MPKFVGTDVIPSVATLPGSGSAGQILYHSTSDQYYSWDVSEATWKVLGSSSGGAAGILLPAGSIIAWTSATIPAGFLQCDGTTRVRTAFPELFAAIGTTYNTGGEAGTDFRLPNGSGRSLLGTGISSEAGATTHFLGQKSGEETHVLTSGETAFKDHTHNINNIKYVTSAPTAMDSQPGYLSEGPRNATGVSAAATTAGMNSSGNGSPHNNLPPYLGLTWIIAAYGVALPSTSQSVSFEGWHNIGDSGEPQFANSWQSVGGVYGPARYRITPDGKVQLSGQVKLGTLGSTAFTLPAAYRPSVDTMFSAASNTIGQVLVKTDGSVQPVTGDPAWISLATVEFPTAQLTFPSSVTTNALDLWHIVGGTGEPAFQNTYTNFGSNETTAKYFKDPFGIVHLEGLVTRGTGVPTSGDVIFTLPIGYRPDKNHIFSASLGENRIYCRVDVQFDGTVKFLGGTSTAVETDYVSLAGISFTTGQTTTYALMPPAVDPSIQTVSLTGASNYTFSGIDLPSEGMYRITIKGGWPPSGSDYFITARLGGQTGGHRGLVHRVYKDNNSENMTHDFVEQPRDSSTQIGRTDFGSNGMGFFTGTLTHPGTSGGNCIYSGYGTYRSFSGSFGTGVLGYNFVSYQSITGLPTTLTIDFGGGTFTGQLILEKPNKMGQSLAPGGSAGGGTASKAFGVMMS